MPECTGWMLAVAQRPVCLVAPPRWRPPTPSVRPCAACVRARFAGWSLNGSASHRYEGNLNIRREGTDMARLMSDVRQVMFSAGSACASESKKPSRILAALGLSPDQTRGSIRLGFGRFTTLAEFEEAAEMLNSAAMQQG